MKSLAGQLLLSFGVWVALLGTNPTIGLTWDEANYLRFADALIAGVGAWLTTPATLAEIVGQYYLVDIHPSFVRLLAAVSDCGFGHPRTLLTYRLGTMFLFSVAAAALGGYAARRWGTLAGALGVALFVGVPSVFAHAHLVATETPLTALWLLATLAWLDALRRGGTGRWVQMAVILGLLLAVKITAGLWLLPAGLWLLARHRAQWRSALFVVLGAGVIFLILQPNLWVAPAAGARWFLERNLQRAEYYPHWSYFLGEVYEYSPPWYYGPVVLGATLPPLLLLGLAAALVGWRRASGRPEDGLFAGTVLLFLFVTALPGAPGGDGNRYLLPAVPFAALLALRGLAPLLDRLRGWGRPAATILLALLALLPLGGSFPYPMSYYNFLVGGEAGALRLGLETTYWWDVVNADAVREINAVLPANAVLLFIPADPWVADRHRLLGHFRPDLTLTTDPDTPASHLLILSRPRHDFPRLFQYARAAPSLLTPLWFAHRDGVPLAVLYAKEPRP